MRCLFVPIAVMTLAAYSQPGVASGLGEPIEIDSESGAEIYVLGGDERPADNIYGGHSVAAFNTSFGLMNIISARLIHPDLKSTRNHPSRFFLWKRTGDRLPNSLRSYCAHVRPISRETMNPVVYGDAVA